MKVIIEIKGGCVIDVYRYGRGPCNGAAVIDLDGLQVGEPVEARALNLNSIDYAHKETQRIVDKESWRLTVGGIRPTRYKTEMGVIRGYYCEEGYLVYIGIRLLYQAGNHRQDSTDYAEPGSKEALPLRTLRNFCIKTARELAVEHKAKFGGVTRTINLQDLP